MAPSRALKRFASCAAQAQAQYRTPSPFMHNIRSAYVRICSHRSISTLSAHTQTTRPTKIASARTQARRWAQRASPIGQSLNRSYSAQSADNTPNAVQPPDYLNEKELHVFNKIKAELEPVRLEVQDISGGCGSMYALSIESPKFKGLSIVKQHKLVNSILAEEISGWHGVQLRTKAV